MMRMIGSFHFASIERQKAFQAIVQKASANEANQLKNTSLNTSPAAPSQSGMDPSGIEVPSTVRSSNTLVMACQALCLKR
jgi:hypothetical protein